MRGQRAARPILRGQDPLRTGQVDNYGGQSLNYGIPVIDGNYYPLLNLRDPLIENTGRNWGDYAIGHNWPQVPALYGQSQRTGASPMRRAGGALNVGVANTNRWTTQNLQAYLMGEGMARQQVYSAAGNVNTKTAA